MQTTLVLVLFMMLVLSLVTGNWLKDAEKRFIHSFSTETCVNRLDHCADYGQYVCSDPYTKWAKENCAKMCNFCSSVNGGGVLTPPVGGLTDTCVNKLGHCADYGQYVCSDPYTKWAKENCAKMCNFCSSGSGGGVPTPSVPGSGLTGCMFKSQVYQQGQTWNDGCKYKCECVDGTSGQYRCSVSCWKLNLPNSCHMDPPAPGKCCPTPNCPPSVLLQYPTGYEEE